MKNWSDFVREENPEDLWATYEALEPDDSGAMDNFLYYVSRIYAGHAPEAARVLRTGGPA